MLCMLCAQAQASDLQELLRNALDEYVPPVPAVPVVPVVAAVHHQQHQSVRNGRQIQSADPGALMYLPIGGSGNIRWVINVINEDFKVKIQCLLGVQQLQMLLL